MKALLYIIGLVSIMAACTSVDCSEYGMVVCTYDVINTSEKDDTIPLNFSVVAKNNIDGSDTTLINLQSNVMDFELPMSYVLPTDTLYFSIQDKTTSPDTIIRDTVYINKIDMAHFEGNDCAPRYFHEIKKVWSTHNFLDTLIINNSAVQNNAAETNIYVVIPADL